MYHSALVKLGTFSIERTGDIQNSKFDQSKRVVPVRVNGEENWLEIENPTVESWLSQLPQGQAVQASAAGSRDSAVISIANGGQPQPAPQQTTQQPRPNSNGSSGPKLDATMGRCLKSASFLVTSVVKNLREAGVEPDDNAILEAIHANAATLFIQASRNGGAAFAYDTASIGKLRQPAPTQPVTQPQQPAPEPEPQPATAGAPNGSGPFDPDDDLPF